MATEAPRPYYLPPQSPSSPRAAIIPAGVPRIPAGVPDFDFLTGGLPHGAVVLLFGEAGSGHQEFALTSAVHLMMYYDDPAMHKFYLGHAKGPFSYPSGVVYVSTSRSREQVLDEIRGAFPGSYSTVLARHLKFHDLSPSYFADSVVPSSWASVSSPLLSGVPATLASDGGPLRSLAEAVDVDGQGNLVIIDSITDLLSRRGADMNELVTFVKGLRRKAKEWGGIVYLILSRGVAPPSTEQAIVDSVDGVLAFSWTTNPARSQRQRVMLIEKFMPVLSHIPVENQGRFVIRIQTSSGLVTTQYERI